MNRYLPFYRSSAFYPRPRGGAQLTMLLLILLAGGVGATPVTIALCPATVAVGTAVYSEQYFAADGQPRQLLVLGGQQQPTGCETQVVESGTERVLWAGLLPPDQRADRLRYLVLQGNFSARATAVSEIISSNEDGKATQPGSPDQKVPANARMQQSGFASHNPDRTAWLWSPSLWQDTPELVWQLQTHQHLGGIYVTVPVNDDGEVRDPLALAAFISAASQRNLKVWAVIGDPRDVLAASRAALQTRLEAYKLYNQSVAAGEKLKGVQLDIEPYLLPGFALAQSHWRDSYLGVVAFAHEQLGKELALDLVMPGWWGTHPDWGNQLLEALAMPDLSITVMNYQTDPARLRRAAEPFLLFGQRTGTPVRMALETGRLPDETRRYYAGNARTGELWLLDVHGNGVLLLLSAKVAGLAGQGFSFTGEKRVSASDTTFAGNLPLLDDVMGEVESQWSNWPTFAGIALHGLEAALTAGEP